MRLFISIGMLCLALTLDQGMATEELEKVGTDDYVETTEEGLEGKLARGAYFGHPRIPGANTGSLLHPYPYKPDQHSTLYPPQYPAGDYHQDHHNHIYKEEYYGDDDPYYKSKAKHQANEEHYYHEHQVFVKELESILSHLSDLLYKFKSHKCPKGQYSSENSCDPKKWGKCTCMSPAEFSDDGRGNCNLGAIKADTQVWCYVDDKFGDPSRICPDSKKSNSKYGYYWSRYACIT